MARATMTGKPERDFKLKWYPAVGITLGVALLLGSAWMVIHRQLIQMPNQTASLGRVAVGDGSGESPRSTNNQATVTPLPSPLSPAKEQVPQEQTSAALPTEASEPAGNPAIQQGSLRISNPTNYPVRVALLSRKSSAEGEASGTTAITKPYDEVPAHWDFAPQEGGTKGLIVSLPDRRISLKKGDVLVAFAQDGSRRYWGPYIVGETSFPVWNAKAHEWQLSLQP